MCGRYLFTSPPEAVANAFGVDVRENFPPRWNVAPTQAIATIRVFERKREFALQRWGFIPSWAKKDYHDRMGSKPLINARGETAAEKPVFRNAWKRRRCLVPSNGFYEWKAEKSGKQPFLIETADKALFGFAGLWETAVDADGGEIDTVAILTTEAGPDMRPLHSREPVVIQPTNYDRWLDAEETESENIAPLVRAAPEGFWKFHEVSKAVNNVRNEGETLAKQIGQMDFF